MRMCADIKFDRPLDPRNHHISPGSYRMVAEGMEYEFDFYQFYGYRDKSDPTILHCTMEDLDTESFPDAKEFVKHIDKIEKVSEFFVYTGEPDEEHIIPLEVLSVVFINGPEIIAELNHEMFKNAIAY